MPPRQPPAQFSSLQQSNLDLYNPPPLVPCNVRIEVVSSREAKVHSNFLFSNESQIKFVSMYIPLNVCIPNLLPHPNSLQNITNLYEDGNVIYFPIHSFRIWKSPRLITKCRKELNWECPTGSIQAFLRRNISIHFFFMGPSSDIFLLTNVHSFNLPT